MKSPKPNKPTKTELARKVASLEAQLIHTYYFATHAIDKTSTDKMTASGVILTITALNGSEIVTPVCIRDGLSAETITALKADFLRSWERATELSPKDLQHG